MEHKDTIIADVLGAAGSASALAEQIGITPQALSQWTRVPVARVLDVERVTGISRHDLRPDIYGPAPSTHPEEAGR